MSLQEKIKKVLYKEPYQHDVEALWAEIENQLPPKKKNRIFPFIFLILILSSVLLWRSQTMSDSILGNNYNKLNGQKNTEVKFTNEEMKNAISTKFEKNSEVLKHKESTVRSKNVNTTVKIKNNENLITNNQEKIASNIYKFGGNLSQQSSPPLSMTTTVLPDVDLSKKLPQTDFLAFSHAAMLDNEKSKSSLIDSYGENDNVFFELSKSKHIEHCEFLSSEIDFFDLPQRTLTLHQKIPIKHRQKHENYTKSPWGISMATLAFRPSPVYKGQREYTAYKQETEINDPSLSIALMAGKNFYKKWGGHIGLQYDRINHYHQSKFTTVRFEKIKSDSASYYISGDKLQYVAGELTKKITEGKSIKAINTLQRWSIPVDLSYKFNISNRLSITPSTGLTYTFSQQYDGITVNDDLKYVYHDKDAFSTMYKSKNLLAWQTGVAATYRITDLLMLDVRYQYASDMHNNLTSTQNSLLYKRHAFGVGFFISHF